MGVYAMCMWKSKDSLQALVLPCHSVGPGDTVQDTGIKNQATLPTEPSYQPYNFFSYQK